MSNCKVISISNQKGGTGKTCSACNLGIGLARKGFKVLVIDADAQGSLTASLGYRNQDELDVTLATVLEMIINDEEVDLAFGIFHHEEGVDLILYAISRILKLYSREQQRAVLNIFFIIDKYLMSR